MSIFKSLSTPKRATRIYIGWQENTENRCLIWQNGEQIKSVWQKPQDAIGLAISQLTGDQHLATLVRPIPYQYIWRKTFYLPFIENPFMLHKQIINVLKQELPLAIEQVYFDFHILQQADENITRVTLLALRKEYAQPMLSDYPTILDCELHCYYRAFQHYQDPTQQQKSLYYQVNNLIFRFEPQGLQMLYTQTTEQTIQTINIDQFNIPNVIDKTLYFSALGASLWNGTV